MGIPFQIKSPLNFETIKKADSFESRNVEFEHHAKEESEELIRKAREEAEYIIREAQLEAAKIMESAEEEISSTRAGIEQEAWQKGYEDGAEEAKRQYEDLIREAEMIREHAKVEYKEVLAGIESNVVDTVMEVARKVIGVEISFNKDDVLYLVKQAFEKCANKENIALRVSPDDYDYICDNKERLLSMVEGVGELEIKKDTRMKEGACIVETPYGSIDAGVQTKLKKIEEAFRQAIGK